MVGVVGHDRGAFEGLAITDHLLESHCSAWDLADHPSLQHFVELLEMRLVEEVEEHRIGAPALEVQTQCLIQRLPVPLEEGLQIA